MEQRLRSIIGEVIDEKGARLVALETMPDHVHLLVEMDPQYGVHRVGAPLSTIRRYVVQQRQR